MTKQVAAQVTRLCKAGEYNEAVRVGHAGLRAVPRSVVLHRKMAFVHAARQDYGSALEHITLAEGSSHGVNAKVYAERAKLEELSGTGSPNESAAKAIALNPSQTQHIYYLAEHEWQGDYIVLDHASLVYSPIPKAASTSIKAWLFDLDVPSGGTGPGPHKRFDGRRTRRDRQRLAAETPETYFRFAVTRNEVDRFTSYHAKNVVEGQSLSRSCGGRSEFFGLPTTPTIDELAVNLPRYRFVFRDVAHHTLPSAAFLHPDSDFYDLVVPMAELSTLTDRVSEHLGRQITFPHELRSSPSTQAQVLSGAGRSALETHLQSSLG